MYLDEREKRIRMDSIKCIGGNGYINDYKVGSLLRDEKIYEIGGGKSEVRRIVIGR